jgi:glyoxylase-like metal-dependent hydrolase (beta-lactamase superfamily II)
MKLITLEQGLKVAHFNKEAKGEFVSYNIVVIEDGSNCLIIDTAFRRHFNRLVDYLDVKHKTITDCIVTHFHRDHIGGLPKLRSANIYGSYNSLKTLKKVFKEESFENYKPTIFVDKKTTLHFGKHEIVLIKNIGHSIDGLLVVIDKKYIIVGDDMIYDVENDPLLPFPSENDIKAHIKSLKRIEALCHKDTVIIPAHGLILNRSNLYLEDISNRIKYLKYILVNKRKNEVDFENETGIHFNAYKWYIGNV